ncbi:hypothetical protein NM208_g9161 [Fusarium decemcellulare]|uniref:Uncharacterized protein n=1 Tax=Fusarium decemcellulare TaxID=57161 RepID=A0ACC1S2M5_9HYPO|nr:hypothetical protein NM208_g9161 [Fusarium decemcellulare]
MHLKQPRRAARVVPQCNIPPIIIRHPNYAYHESALLSFPPLDGVTDHDETDGPNAAWGVHYGTVITACQIITENNLLVYLSHEAAGGHPAPRENQQEPFAVLCSMEDWKFPHNLLPNAWAAVEYY